MADRRCLGSRSSKNEGLGFVKPLWRAVVASGGSKSSNIEGLGFLAPLWPTVVASSRSKSSKIEGLGFSKPPWPSLWYALGAFLGDLGTLLGLRRVALGRLGLRLGDLGTLQGHFGDLIVEEYAGDPR